MTATGNIFNKTLLFFIFLLFPTQLAFHFWPDWSYVWGLRIDYFSPAVYLVDLIIVLYVGLNFSYAKEAFFNHKNFYVLILTFALLNILFSILPSNSVVKWGRVFFYITFFLTSINKHKLKDFLLPLGAGAGLAGLISVVQFVIQKNVGGLFYFLGERAIKTDTIGAALIEIDGHDYLRAYSTFSHPNSLGGYMLLTLTLLVLFWPKGFVNKLKYLLMFLSIAGIILSFSKTAIIGLFTLFVLEMLRKNFKKFFVATFIIFFLFSFFSLLLPLVSNNLLTRNPFYSESITNRLVLAKAAFDTFLKHPLFGVGLNNSIKAYEISGSARVFPVTLQPVHNIFLLVLTETGLTGFLLFFVGNIYFLVKLTTKNKKKLIIVLILIAFTGLFDHYSLTLNQNILIYLFIYALVAKEIKNNYVKL